MAFLIIYSNIEMKKIIRTVFNYNLLLSFTIYTVFSSYAGAVTKNRALEEEGITESRASEYVMRRYPGEKLIPIRILGGVKSPGMYYLPEGTDLITALSLSGGLDMYADSSNLTLNQWSSKKVHHFDIADVTAAPEKNNPTLGANDVLFIKPRENDISGNTMLWLTAISSIVGILVGATVLSKGK